MPPCRLLVDQRLCFHVRLCRNRDCCVLGFQLEHGVLDIALGYDGVPLKYRPGSPPTDFHDDPSATPARRRLRAAVRRRSWKSRLGTPASTQAFLHCSRKSLTRLPSGRVNTYSSASLLMMQPASSP